ncbi:histone lysine demethylation [Paramecium bursaria]
MITLNSFYDVINYKEIIIIGFNNYDENSIIKKILLLNYIFLYLKNVAIVEGFKQKISYQLQNFHIINFNKSQNLEKSINKNSLQRLNIKKQKLIIIEIEKSKYSQKLKKLKQIKSRKKKSHYYVIKLEKFKYHTNINFFFLENQLKLLTKESKDQKFIRKQQIQNSILHILSDIFNFRTQFQKNKISWNKFSNPINVRFSLSILLEIVKMFYDFLCRRTGLDPRDKKKKADVKDIELKIQSTSFVEFYGDFRLQEPYESRLLELVKHYYLQFQRKDTNIKPTEFYGPVVLLSEQIQTSEFNFQEKVYVHQLTSNVDLSFKDIIKQYPDLDAQIFVLDPKANGFNLDKSKQIKKYSTKLCKFKKYQYHNPAQALSVYINDIPDKINFKNQIPTQISDQDGLNFLTQKYPGINEPGLWFRMKDSWQRAKQDKSHLCVMNWNHGPGTLVWYSIEFNSISQYKDPSLLQKDHIWFIKDPNFFLNQNLPIRVTYQRPNDLIIIGAGNIFWNYAIDDLLCSEWNYLSLNQFSLEVFIEKIDYNQEKKQKCSIPMINLLIDINLHQKTDSIDDFLKSAIQDEIKIIQKDDLALKCLKQYCDNRIIYCKKCKSEPIVFYQIIDEKTNYCVNCLDLTATNIVLGARYINNLYGSNSMNQCHEKICRKSYSINNCLIFNNKLNKQDNIVEKKQQDNNQISQVNSREQSYAYRIRIEQMKSIFLEKQMEYYKKLNKKGEGTLDLIKSIILNVEVFKQIEFDLSNSVDEQKEGEGLSDIMIPKINHQKYAYLLRNFSDHEAIFQFYESNSSVNHFMKFLQEIEAPWWEVIEQQNEFESKWKKLTQGWLKRALRWHDEIDFELQLVLDGSSDQQNSQQQQKSLSQRIQIQKEEISKQFDDQDEQNDLSDQHKQQQNQLDQEKLQDHKPIRKEKKQKSLKKTKKNNKAQKLTIKTRKQKMLDELNDPTEHIEPNKKKQQRRIPEIVETRQKQKKVRLFF